MDTEAVPMYYDYDGGSMVAERPGWGYMSRSYLPGVSTTDEWGGKLYYHADAHGSNRMMTDSSGFSYANEDFDAWGKTVAYNGGGVGTYGYAGDWGYRKDQYVDSANTGSLIQCGVRHYDPDLGRFLQMDRILGHTGHPETFNRYVYCGNEPANNVDPSGLQYYENEYGELPDGTNQIAVSAGAIAGLAFMFGTPVGWALTVCVGLACVSAFILGWEFGVGCNKLFHNSANGEGSTTQDLWERFKNGLKQMWDRVGSSNGPGRAFGTYG